MSRQFNVMKQLFPAIIAVAIFMLLMLFQSVTVQASPQHGQEDGRIDTVNENDFHTAAWDRFSFNYQFVSGSDHRFELGRPTIFNGFVPVDVFNVNLRRDANVSLRPPSYGIFSGNFQTEPTSRFFTQPVNPHFHQPFLLESTALDPRFDTNRQGVNAPPIGNPINMQQSVSTGEFLPPTSIR